jgi:hypothetical protein
VVKTGIFVSTSWRGTLIHPRPFLVNQIVLRNLTAEKRDYRNVGIRKPRQALFSGSGNICTCAGQLERRGALIVVGEKRPGHDGFANWNPRPTTQKVPSGPPRGRLDGAASSANKVNSRPSVLILHFNRAELRGVPQACRYQFSVRLPVCLRKPQQVRSPRYLGL